MARSCSTSYNKRHIVQKWAEGTRLKCSGEVGERYIIFNIVYKIADFFVTLITILRFFMDNIGI